MQASYLETESSDVKKAGFTEHIEKALLFIDYNFFMPIKVADIAKYVSLERTYFSFKGVSPKKYRIQAYFALESFLEKI